MLWYALRVVLLIGVVNFCGSSRKVRLTDVSVLTLHQGKYTTGRRSASLPQIQCVGGSAKGKFEPRVVQCYNKGYDGTDVQWECKAEMSDQYEFGELSISCEGYDYPDDPYILQGSCGLKYNLEYSREGGRKNNKETSKEDPQFGLFSLSTVAVLLLIFLIVYCNCLQPPTDGSRTRRSGSSWDQGPPPPPGYGRPPPPGFKRFTYQTDAPPTYEESFYNSFGSQSQSSGLGFLPGLGLGGLMGYLYGRNQNQNSEDSFLRNRRSYEQDGSRRSHDSFADYSPGPSTSRSTSGFGGTERR